MDIDVGSKTAVFARNHRKYLEESAERNREDRTRLTTFRSAATWTTARRANEGEGPLEIYFAPIGGNNLVEYQADLLQVILNPSRGDRATEEALTFQLSSTENEGLWGGDARSVRTLYVVSRCVPVKRPFPMSALHKKSDGLPISEGFGYSYCIVYPHQPGPVRDFESLPEEIDPTKRYPEGSTRQVSVDVYERSAAARKACISHYGCRCVVCEFDFERVYGDIGVGFIHVHHIRPLAEVDAQYDVDPVIDLRPVCPNCHAMIHRGENALSVDELRDRIKR